MARWHNYYIDGCAHFCTVTVRDWEPALSAEVIGAIYKEWETAKGRQGVRILAYVIMPEHIHIVLWCQDASRIPIFLQQFLGRISKRFRPGVGKFWKERPHVFPIHSEKLLAQKMDYIHRNPLRRELVVGPEEWLHSSFRQLFLGASDVPFVCDVLEA